MPNAIFDAFRPQNDMQTQLAQFKQQFAPNTDPMQVINQMLQSGQITQEQLNAAYVQAQQLFSRR